MGIIDPYLEILYYVRTLEYKFKLIKKIGLLGTYNVFFKLKFQKFDNFSDKVKPV